MKIRALLILIALTLSILSPLSVSPSRHVRRTDDHSYIVTLDVCKTAGSAVSVSTDTPALQECPSKVFPFDFYEYTEVIYPQSKPSLIAFQLKRPPKA